MQGYVVRKGDRFYAVIYEGMIRSPDGSGDAGTLPARTASRPSRSQPSSPNGDARTVDGSAPASRWPST